MQIEVTRAEMISALTRYDLRWIASGNVTTQDLWTDCVGFFARGGYSTWDDKELIDLYQETIAPDDADVTVAQGVQS